MSTGQTLEYGLVQRICLRFREASEINVCCAAAVFAPIFLGSFALQHIDVEGCEGQRVEARCIATLRRRLVQVCPHPAKERHPVVSHSADSTGGKVTQRLGKRFQIPLPSWSAHLDALGYLEALDDRPLQVCGADQLLLLSNRFDRPYLACWNPMQSGHDTCCSSFACVSQCDTVLVTEPTPCLLQ